MDPNVRLFMINYFIKSEITLTNISILHRSKFFLYMLLFHYFRKKSTQGNYIHWNFFKKAVLGQGSCVKHWITDHSAYLSLESNTTWANPCVRKSANLLFLWFSSSIPELTILKQIKNLAWWVKPHHLLLWATHWVKFRTKWLYKEDFI